MAAALATGTDLDTDLAHVLGIVRQELAADAAAVWLSGPPFRRIAGAGDPAALPDDDEIARLVDDPPATGPIVATIMAAGRLLGAIAVVPSPAAQVDGEAGVFVSAVADMLAPVLRDAAYTHRLEREVVERTRDLEAQRRFTARIIDSIPVGLYVIDRDYRIQAWNHKRETGMQGVSREEAIGRTIFEILHRQPAGTLRAEFEEVFRTGRMQQFHTESEASGEVRTYRLSKIPMRVNDGEVTHVITIGEDITEWRNAQDRFAQAEKLAAIGTLAAGVMHEINNPLATIGACAESLSYRVEDGAVSGPFASELTDALRVIDHEVQRCKGIVNGLLDFSRPSPATKSAVDLNSAVERTLFLLKHHARFKRMNVEVTLGAAPLVFGNEEQLIQVFMALLLNAMDAMDGQGTVAIRTKLDEGRDFVCAEVVDRGGGIRRADVDRIFEPFFTTKPPGRGTGLGLSICYAIVREHGGSIEVDTGASGSVFRILLPRATEAALAT